MSGHTLRTEYVREKYAYWFADGARASIEFDEWLSVQTAASEDAGRDIERRALGNALELLGRITERARDEIKDAKAGATYAAQINSGGAVMAQESREEAWATVLRIIRHATGVGDEC